MNVALAQKLRLHFHKRKKTTLWMRRVSQGSRRRDRVHMKRRGSYTACGEFTIDWAMLGVETANPLMVWPTQLCEHCHRIYRKVMK